MGRVTALSRLLRLAGRRDRSFAYQRRGRPTSQARNVILTSSDGCGDNRERGHERSPFSLCTHPWGGALHSLKALVGLAALAFVLAVVTHFTGALLKTSPEAYSRACTNLGLLGIALVVTSGDRVGAGRPPAVWVPPKRRKCHRSRAARAHAALGIVFVDRHSHSVSDTLYACSPTSSRRCHCWTGWHRRRADRLRPDKQAEQGHGVNTLRVGGS